MFSHLSTISLKKNFNLWIDLATCPLLVKIISQATKFIENIENRLIKTCAISNLVVRYVGTKNNSDNITSRGCKTEKLKSTKL